MAISDPNGIEGCVLWLDPTDPTSFDVSSGVVTEIRSKDAEGGRRPFNTTTGTGLKTGDYQLNGLETWSTAGADHGTLGQGATDLVPIDSDMTVFIYCELRSAQNGRLLIDRFNTSSHAFRLGSSGVNWRMGASTDFIPTMPQTLATPLVGVAYFAGASSYIEEIVVTDNVPQSPTTSTTGDAGSNPMNRLYIGGSPTQSSNSTFYGVVAYDRLLDTSERDDVVDYLVRSYLPGAQLSAPATSNETASTLLASVTSDTADQSLFCSVRTSAAYTVDDGDIIKAGTGAQFTTTVTSVVGTNNIQCSGLTPGVPQHVGFVQDDT